jgi:hypothetical protein
MSDARVVKGWCPFHDHVVEAADGLCPDCRRPLVALTGEGRPERIMIVPDDSDAPGEPVTVRVGEEEDEELELPPSSLRDVELGPAALASIVTAIVLIAFFAGITVSRKKSETTKPAAPQAKEEYTVGTTSRGAGVTLRLASFSQRGKRIVMRVDVPDDQPINSGRIGRAEVEFVISGGGRNTIAVLPTRSTVSGFIIDDNVLERADLPVYAVKINSITLTDIDGKLIGVDLSEVWRTGLTAPRSVATNIAGKVGRRTFTLTGLVGWTDRLEARFELAGEKSGWRYDDRFGLIIAGQSSIEGSIVPSDRHGAMHVVFEGQQRGRTAASILIHHESLTIGGDWLWTLPPGR